MYTEQGEGERAGPGWAKGRPNTLEVNFQYRAPECFMGDGTGLELWRLSRISREVSRWKKLLE